MSAGTGASNLDYGNSSPFDIANRQYANTDNSHYSGGFGSNVNPRILIKGGSKKIKRKIKNITKYYKRMKAGSRKIKTMKRKLKTRAISRQLALAGGRRRSRRASRRHRQRGGYSQYQNNMPFTNSYQVAGIHLSPNESALANPAPITRLGGSVNCIDNYNHYAGMGSPSKGH